MSRVTARPAYPWVMRRPTVGSSEPVGGLPRKEAPMATPAPGERFYFSHGFCTSWAHGVLTGPEPTMIRERTGQKFCQRCSGRHNWPPGPHPSY